MENSRYLIFASAGRSFSLPFEEIKIIIAAQTPTPVPDFPDYVPGTVVNEGEVVPVIDLRRRFHYESKEISDRDCIIITMGEEVSVGLLCDSVTGFKRQRRSLRRFSKRRISSGGQAMLCP